MIYLSIFYKYRLQRIILLLVLAFYSLVLCAQFVDYERITPHPRLLLTQGGEEAVKSRSGNTSGTQNIQKILCLFLFPL